MPDEEFVHKNATVIVGNDEDANLTVIFVVKKNGAVVFSFPRPVGEGRTFSSTEMELFLLVSVESDMLKAIRQAWQERERVQ